MSKNLKSSFRDNHGFVYHDENVFYRQVNESYRSHYDMLLTSGLYKCLVDNRLLLPHEEISRSSNLENCYKTLLPKQISFISYAYSWCFSMFKDAALLTLNIQKNALKYGMTLKDATSFNIQFYNGQLIFIDTLSFEKYDEGTQWKAYNQFCNHFLAPLALMSYTDLSLNQLLISHIDGIPLELASKLLPLKSKFNFGLFLHLFMHSKSQRKFKKSDPNRQNAINLSSQGSIQSIERIIDSLISTVESCNYPAVKLG